ncbi:MAG TPA: hypothetical protein VMJ30_11325 [Gemmatimonadales bacterium]|nr:hypothetical protein [Gemmatimonadales bacterium]
MSKRLQVLFDDDEYRDMQRAARHHRLTVSAWVRQALRELIRSEPVGDQERKLRAVREAARHAYPAPPIADMLREIESGYHEDPPA